MILFSYRRFMGGCDMKNICSLLNAGFLVWNPDQMTKGSECED
jgi:hypothetical protein